MPDAEVGAESLRERVEALARGRRASGEAGGRMASWPRPGRRRGGREPFACARRGVGPMKIHMIGIGGAGMSGIAEVLTSRGPRSHRLGPQGVALHQEAARGRRHRPHRARRRTGRGRRPGRDLHRHPEDQPRAPRGQAAVDPRHTPGRRPGLDPGGQPQRRRRRDPRQDHDDEHDGPRPEGPRREPDGPRGRRAERHREQRGLRPVRPRRRRGGRERPLPPLPEAAGRRRHERRVRPPGLLLVPRRRGGTPSSNSSRSLPADGHLVTCADDPSLPGRGRRRPRAP